MCVEYIEYGPCGKHMTGDRRMELCSDHWAGCETVDIKMIKDTRPCFCQKDKKTGLGCIIM